MNPFKVYDDIKINAKKYSKFLDKTIFLSQSSHNQEALSQNVFMQDSVTSHSAKLTTTYFAEKVFNNIGLMECSLASPGLNSIKLIIIRKQHSRYLESNKNCYM